MDVCFEYCLFSGRVLCDELITHPEDFYPAWCVVVYDLESTWMRRPWPNGGCCAKKRVSGTLFVIVASGSLLSLVKFFSGKHWIQSLYSRIARSLASGIASSLIKHCHSVASKPSFIFIHLLSFLLKSPCGMFDQMAVEQVLLRVLGFSPVNYHCTTAQHSSYGPITIIGPFQAAVTTYAPSHHQEKLKIIVLSITV
jgi:hypothetical protein